MKPVSARNSCALMIAALFAGTATAQAAEAPKFAWGKAGVSYQQYRDEAYDCAMIGLATDIDKTAPVEKLRSASRQMEALDGRLQGMAGASDPAAAGMSYAADAQAIQASARPEKQVAAIKEIIFPVIQQCMIKRGYTRFALTEDQRAHLATFKDRSDERRAYLHTLASNADILEKQKQPLPE